MSCYCVLLQVKLVKNLPIHSLKAILQLFQGSFEALSGQVLTVLMVTACFLMRVSAGARSRDRWSDWPRCGSCIAL